MAVHDQRIKYLDQLNSLVKTPATKGSIIGMKAHDYIVFSGPNADVDKAYQMCKEAVDLKRLLLITSCSRISWTFLHAN